LEQTEDAFKSTNLELRELMDAVDEKYPQGRIDLGQGKITYQPGAPSRKQQMEMQQQQQAENSGMKVVKE
jgi:hypothetical protein